MIEKSVLNEEEIKEELKKRYGFKHVQNISKILMGSANIFKIICDGDAYILKEYQSLYRLDDIKREEHITRLLQENGIPSVEMVFCINGDYAWECKERVLVLQKFVEGEVVDSYTGSNTMMKESAFYLSKINLILKNISLEKEDNTSEWLTPENLLKVKQKYNKIIEKCEEDRNNLIFQKIRRDILIKKKLLNEFMENKEVIDSLSKVTHMNSHGDYSVLQFIYEPDTSKIKVILDLSVAGKLPIVWEIIRSYSYMDPLCKEGEINIENLKNYVREYMKNIKISKIDLVMMPYVYLIQLLKSSFGYSQYVLSPSENKDQLIEFAFWRTKMCMWLASNAKKLSKELELLG
jgi:hypothetical protein